MNTRFPAVPSSYSTTFLNQLVMALTGYFSQVVSNGEQTNRIILRSPSGANYDLTVSDAGTLVVTPTSKTRA